MLLVCSSSTVRRPPPLRNAATASTLQRPMRWILACTLILLVQYVPFRVSGQCSPLSGPSSNGNAGTCGTTITSGMTCSFKCNTNFQLVGAPYQCVGTSFIGYQQCLQQSWRNEGILYPAEPGGLGTCSFLLMPAGSAGAWRNTALPPVLAAQALNRPFYLVLRKCTQPCLQFFVTFDAIDFYPFTPTVSPTQDVVGSTGWDSGLVTPTYGVTNGWTIWLPHVGGPYHRAKIWSA